VVSRQASVLIVKHAAPQGAIVPLINGGLCGMPMRPGSHLRFDFGAQLVL